MLGALYSSNYHLWLAVEAVIAVAVTVEVIVKIFSAGTVSTTKTGNGTIPTDLGLCSQFQLLS